MADLDPIQIERRLTRLEENCDSMGDEIVALQDNQTEIRSLALSVNTLATEVKHLVEDSCKKDSRIDKLEQLPAQRWNDLVKTIMTVIASGVAGYFVSHFLK